MALDLAEPLPGLFEEGPCGPNLEFDGAFGALERAAQGTPERQAGDKIVPAEDPVWKEVAALAAALLERTYDLRVMSHLAIARLHVSGLGEFAKVMAAMATLLQTRWEQVHPQLDPEDDNDPALRANALLPLAHPTRVLRALRTMPLATSKRAGPVSWRTVAVALGSVEAATAQEKQTEGEIRAAFADTPPNRVEAVRENIAAAVRATDGITAAFDSNSGYGNAPDLGPLTKLLKEMGRYIGQYFTAEASPQAPGEAEAGDAATDDGPPAAWPGGNGGGGNGGGGNNGGGNNGGGGGGNARGGGPVTAMALSAVATREEAMHLLDIVCRYYEQYEPSSPLPLMLARARNLATKSFLEILQDLAPDGVFQAQTIVQSRDG